MGELSPWRSVLPRLCVEGGPSTQGEAKTGGPTLSDGTLPGAAMTKLSHLDDKGEARMVDVSDKAATHRTARAEGFVAMAPATLALIEEGAAKKGDVLAAARIAGIMAAKKTHELIPLCHPLGDHQGQRRLRAVARARRASASPPR